MLAFQFSALLAAFFTPRGLDAMLCGIMDDSVAREAFEYCFGEEVPDLDWDDPPVRIRCSTELELQVNCSEAEANLTVSSINGMSPFIKFMGSCNFSSGDSRETIVKDSFKGNMTIALPDNYTECIFSGCYLIEYGEPEYVEMYTNKTICKPPRVITEPTSQVPRPSTENEWTTAPGGNTTLTREPSIGRDIGVVLCVAAFMTTVLLVVMYGMLVHHRRKKRHLKNMSIRHGVTLDLDLQSNGFKPMEWRLDSSKSQESLCDPLYEKKLKGLGLEESIHHSQGYFSNTPMTPRIVNITVSYYKQQQQQTDTPNGSVSFFYEDEGNRSVQTNQSNLLVDIPQQPFKQPYYDNSMTDDSEYMDTASKETAATINPIEPCETNSQSSSTADLFIDSNLQKLGNLDTRLGYLPTMNAATEVGGYVLCEQNAVLPMTDSSDHKESSNGGYIENTNKICDSSQYGHESSINYWKSPFDDENENLVPLDEVLCLDRHQQDSEDLFMAYFGDEREASSDYIVNPTDSHHTVYNNKDGYYAT